MIKLGSRTELILAQSEDLNIEVHVGQRILAGTTVMARYAAKPPAAKSGIGNPRSQIPNSQSLIPPPMRPIRTIAVFPTLLTLGNLICGFFAIVVAAGSRNRRRSSAMSTWATRETSCSAAA